MRRLLASRWSAALVLAVVVACARPGGAVQARPLLAARPSGRTAAAPWKTRVWTIHYRAHNGARRAAWVVLPAWYGPHRHPRIPLIVSPHGRGVSGRANTAIWGALPGLGSFAVVNPDGQGRRLPRYSWGSFGQVEDLARMPDIVTRTLPWLRIDRRRVYAFGGSMGGQETLLLLARHPDLLAGAAVFDSVTDFALQYRNFPRLACNHRCVETWVGPFGRSLQELAREEVGGSPRTRPEAYELRSPATYARTIAASCVPLQIWWSKSDRIVLDQQRQSARLFWRIKELNPYAPVQGFVGFWIHSAEMRATARLPLALETFGLLPPAYPVRAFGLRTIPPPASAPWCAKRP